MTSRDLIEMLVRGLAPTLPPGMEVARRDGGGYVHRHHARDGYIFTLRRWRPEENRHASVIVYVDPRESPSGICRLVTDAVHTLERREERALPGIEELG